MPLTDTAVRQAKATGKNYTLKDADGLALYVSAKGAKQWHFRFCWGGRQPRISFGSYPEITLKQAREQRDQARALVAQGIDPRHHRRQAREAAVQAAQNTFKEVFLSWRAFKGLTLRPVGPEEGRQSTLSQIDRIFEKDVLRWLGPLSVFDISRRDLLEVLRRIEKRRAFSTAEKCRTWFNQLFRYAMVERGLEVNPAADLDIVAVPAPPVRHNPHLRIDQLPAFLGRLRQYRGERQTQLGIRLLLLTGVRTGELRAARPEQFDLARGLWIIPPAVVKQLQKQLRRDDADIPPYVVPLSQQAIAVVEELLGQVLPSQRYLFRHRSEPKRRISENTLNAAVKRMGYEGLLTGHGIRGTLSTALNEMGYPDKWIDAQLSHKDKNKVRAAYNHAKYIEPRRKMMQDWADCLDQWEKDGFASVEPMPSLPWLSRLEAQVD
ncbi:integrase [Pseudomonas sp. PIC25]|nr:integrase [Pseudomonas sp. PIC25]